MVKQKKFEQTFINEYMAWNLHDSDIKKQAAAQQKAEDEKLIAQKDALISSKNAEVARQSAENMKLSQRIKELEALLARK